MWFPEMPLKDSIGSSCLVLSNSLQRWLLLQETVQTSIENEPDFHVERWRTSNAEKRTHCQYCSRDGDEEPKCAKNDWACVSGKIVLGGQAEGVQGQEDVQCTNEESDCSDSAHWGRIDLPSKFFSKISFQWKRTNTYNHLWSIFTQLPLAEIN